MHHGTGERFSVLLAGKIQPIDKLGVPPLVERGRRLVVLEALDDGTVDDDFVVLQLAAHYPECVVLLVVEDLHLAEAGRAARWDPLFLAIVVHHHRGACTDYALFAHHSRASSGSSSNNSGTTSSSSALLRRRRRRRSVRKRQNRPPELVFVCICVLLLPSGSQHSFYATIFFLRVGVDG